MHILLACKPLQGVRYVVVRERRTKEEYAHFIKDLTDKYPDAEKIVVVKDNLNTHSTGAFYETFEAETARQLARKFEFHFTPKKASWLNIADSEIAAFSKQCLDRRIATIEELSKESIACAKCITCYTICKT